MKQEKLTNLETADLCRETALLIHAGVGLGDGMHLLAEEEKDKAVSDMLRSFAEQLDNGAVLSQVFRDAGCFPPYVAGLVAVGENTGRLEDTLQALSRYYEEREQTERHLRSTLTYPAVLLMLMLVVIVVLLTKVLPVFNDIYASLGGQLSGIAGGMLLIGQALNGAMPILCGLLGMVLIFVAVFSLSAKFRERVLLFFNIHWGDKGAARKRNNARFAEALYLGMASGLPMEESIDMAAALLNDVPPAAKRCETCKTLMQQGASLSEALGKAELIPAAACRLITLGMRSGTADNVMADVAERMSDEARQETERLVGCVEPALVLITSLMVGIIILSVMLPLLNIMSAIG